MKLGFGAASRPEKQERARDDNFKDWRRRFGEATMQRLGLTQEIRDANTGDIESPLNRFRMTCERVGIMGEQCQDFAAAVQGYLKANAALAFLSDAGDESAELLANFRADPLQETMRRALEEHIEAPLNAVRHHIEDMEELMKQRHNDLLDYQHHKRKYELLQEKLPKTTNDQKRAEVQEELVTRKKKLDNACQKLKDVTNDLIHRFDAMEYTFPRFRKQIAQNIAAITKAMNTASLEELTVLKYETHAGATKAFSSIMENFATYRSGGVVPPLEPLQHLEDFTYAVGVNSGSTPGAVFRRPLTDFEDVPDLIFNAIMFLDKHALYAQGLFRVPGNEDTIIDLKRSFDDGEDVQFDETKVQIHDVASLLKLFFREAPEPLIPRSCYRPMLNATGAMNFPAAVQEIISAEEYPHVNRECLRYLLGFLVRVTQCSEHNKMSADNLAIVFAPTLLRAEGSDEISMFDLQNCITLIRFLIEQAEAIFPDIWVGYPVD